MSDEILIDDFSSLDSEELKEITQNYLQLKEDEKHDLAFYGFTDYTNSKKEIIPAVELRDTTGKKFVNANTVLVDECKKIKVVPCVIRIVTGKYRKSRNGGTYLDLELFTLAKNL